MPYKPISRAKPIKVNRSYSNALNAKEYQTKQWRELRAKQIDLKPYCEMCHELGQYGRPDVADHKIPVSEGGAMYDISNLQTLCRSCHAVKTGKEVSRRVGVVKLSV